ncbi:RICIN domain-containing protein [Streptomyces sp. NPDC006512]|uniref:RICIN domain-containing protein n=1 Tax=Streptomyces sp. NPDC006512 TaxID=3154307 RepID=UPI0033BF77D3
MSLRVLAERYPGGRTMWGDYRSGAQIIPLPRLNTVIKDRVPDARGQQIMLAKARDLHALALTAEAERPAVGLDEALERAKQDIAEMGRLIKALLARIDVLEEEAARQPSDAGHTGVSGRPVAAIAAQLDVLREHVAEARRVRDATLEAYGAAQSEAGEEPGGEEGAGAGGELVGSLAALHDTAARRQDAFRVWNADSSSSDPGAVGADASAEPSSGPGGAGETEDGGADADDHRGGAVATGGPAPGVSVETQDGPHGQDGPAGTPSAGKDSAQDSTEAKAEPAGTEPVQEDTRRSGPRLPAGIGLAVLVAACVIGGITIAAYQKGHAGERSPEARLNTPATPGKGPSTPAIEIPAPRTSGPSAEATTTPSPPGPTGEEATPTPKPEPPSPAPGVTPKEQTPKAQTPKPAPPPAVGGGLRTWANAGTQMCLEIRRSAGEDGATANQWTCNNSSSQKWTTTNPGGWTTLVHMDSGKCLEIRGDSRDDGASANQWTCNGSSGQAWRWAAQAGGGWSLVNASEKCLTIRGQGDGALAVQEPCDGSPLQTWN